MRTHVPLALALAGVLLTGAFAGCGDVDAIAIDEEAVTAEDALLARAESWVTVRRDLRRCLAPLCGGYFVKPVNVRAPERYVSGLELRLRALGADERTIAAVEEAPERDLVLRGSLGPAEPRFGTRRFVVTEAHRGLPGTSVDAGERYYRVRALQPMRATLDPRYVRIVIALLDTALSDDVQAIDLDDALLPYVDAEWVFDRVLGHGAIVAGRVRGASDLAASDRKILDVSRVFVGLPARPGPCPLLRFACPAALVATYDRTADRCVVLDRCVPDGECPNVTPPHCPEGYTLVSWRADNPMCTGFACDPAFALR